MVSPYAHFVSIWIVLVTLDSRSGEPQQPLVLAAKDLRDGHLVELGVPKLLTVRRPPFPTGPQALLVCIDVVEVVACHLALGWRHPERLVDLMVEFRNLTNGRPDGLVGGLAGALLWFGLPAVSGLVTGSSPEQMRKRLDAATALFIAMQPVLDLGRALLRGRYLCAAARVEAAGIPVDQRVVERLSLNWPAVKDQVAEIIDREYGMYRGRHLDIGRFARWLHDRDIEWPTLASGLLDLSDDVFREMARAHPDVRPLKELRTTLVGFEPRALAIGRDGRNRLPLRPFASRTGRNQPSTKAWVLGTAAWVRHLIRPADGRGLALIDWQQQEFGIAAALSGDPAMQAAYLSGDPYLALAVKAGAAPSDATNISHAQIRACFKAGAIGILYGMGAARLARQLGVSEAEAQEILRAHRKAFPMFWSWSDTVETSALVNRQLQTVFGWRITVGAEANPRSLRNYPVQANGAEMLRLACCLATETGIRVCALNHDALLVEAPLNHLDDIVVTTQHIMAEASSVVLDGLPLRTDVRVVRSPDRWIDPRGQAVWSAVEEALRSLQKPARQRNAT